MWQMCEVSHSMTTTLLHRIASRIRSVTRNDIVLQIRQSGTLAIYPRPTLKRVTNHQQRGEWAGFNRNTAISLGKKGQKTIRVGPWDRSGSLSHFGDRTHGESPARTSTRGPLHELEPKTYLWRYFAKPLCLRFLANRWRRYMYASSSNPVKLLAIP